MYFVTTAPRSSASMPREGRRQAFVQSVISAEFRSPMVSSPAGGREATPPRETYKAAWFETVAAPCRPLLQAPGGINEHVRKGAHRPSRSSPAQVPLCAVCRHSELRSDGDLLSAQPPTGFGWWGIYFGRTEKVN